MFGIKNPGNTGVANLERLQGPREIPLLVQNYLVNNMKFDADLAVVLRSVTRKKNPAEPKSKSFYIRIFDEADAAANKIEIKNYLTLDEYPNLIIFEGWYDDPARIVELVEKNRLSQETTIFTEAEIRQQIEDLSKPGSSVFFFMARGPACGGPLGRGAIVIQLTPPLEGKKVKKYTVFAADVVNMKPVDRTVKLFDSDNLKDVARYIKEAHHKRMF